MPKAPRQCVNPLQGYHEGGVVGEDNCKLFEVLVAGSPMLVMFTTADLHPGPERAAGSQELLYPYGWDNYFQISGQEIDAAVAVELRVRREVRRAVAGAAAAAGSEAGDSRAAGPAASQQDAAAQRDTVGQREQQQQQQAQQQQQPQQQPQAPQPQQPQAQQQPQVPESEHQSRLTAVAEASAPAAKVRRMIKHSRKLPAAGAVQHEPAGRQAAQPAGRAPKRGLDGACRGNSAGPAAELAAAADAEVSAALATAQQQIHQAVGVHRQQEEQQQQPVYEASRPHHQHQHWQAEPAGVAQAVEVIDLTGDD